jgi:hypothetical protein
MNDELEDQLWFDALQGKAPKGQSRSPTEVQASALRSSVLRSISARPVYETTEAGFEKMLAEAKRRGLLTPQKSALQAAGTKWLSSKFDTLRRTASAVIVVTLGVTTGWQANVMVTRGGSGDSVAQLASSPEEATQIAQGWQKDLLANGIAYSVSFKAPNKTLIRMRMTPATIDLLEGRRILPPKGEWCTVSIEAAPVKP